MHVVTFSNNRQIAYSLRISACVIARPLRKGETSDVIYKETLDVCSPIISVVQQLYEYTCRQTESALSVETFQIIFPVLQSLFTLPALISGCEHAFAVLARYGILIYKILCLV